MTIGSQRAAALPFDSARTQALLTALVVFPLLPHGFRNSDLRAHLVPLLGLDPSLMTQGRMSYDPRRLRLHGLIERIPGTPPLHRHRARTATVDLSHSGPPPGWSGQAWPTCSPRLAHATAPAS